MTFSPVIPFGGYAGWKFLGRTRDAQQQALVADPTTRRTEDYFRQKIGSINTAEELVSDYQLLSVALGAFGLDADIGNKYFIRRVLEDGSLTPDALGNRLADKRYLDLAKAFGFGDFDVPRTKLSDFADKIVADYETHQFETAVGAQDDTMRLALNGQRELALLAERPMSNDAKWFNIMGSAPLRDMVQTALGLPRSFAAIDLDQQLDVFKDRTEQFLGSSEISQFSDPAKVEELIRLFMVRAQITSSFRSVTGQSTALTILQAGSTTGGLLQSLPFG